MSAMLTADWCLLGKDTYFRKFEIYSMEWQQEMNFDNLTIAAAPYAGPIAVIRDRNEFVQIHGGKKPVIAIYSGSGHMLSSFMWSSGQLVAMGWSDSEQLVCVQEDGMVYLYDLHGEYIQQFSMKPDSKLIDAQIFQSPQGTGIAVLSATFKVFLINNIKDPKNRALSEIPPSAHATGPSSWAIVSEQRRNTEAIMICGREIYRLREGEVTCDKPIENGNPVMIAISINAKHAALFTTSGYLWLGSSDFQTKYCELKVDKNSKPKQLVWCGTEAVVCHWPGYLVIISRGGEQASYGYDTALHITPEVDGVRVLSALQHELVQKVLPVVQQVLRINSTEPGSYLLEASKHYQKRSHRADEYIGLVKDQLETAVKQCIEAAGYEFDTDTQKMLIRAAQFGKCFVTDMNSEKYVRMCRELRVLNAVRDRRIGIPLTYDELRCRKYQDLLDRLVMRRHYYLAIQIANYLKLPEEHGSSRILVHWACYKVTQKQLERDSVARQIADKLGHSPGISYSDIANKAADCGRTELAIKLLDYEPRAKQQVELLLRLGEKKPALLKAIESGNTDLIYYVIFDLKGNMPLADFQMTIRNFPTAQALYVKYCREHNRKALIDIYVQEDNFIAQADGFILESYDPQNDKTREALIATAQDKYKKARNDLNASLCDETQKLLKLQRLWEEKFAGNSFIGKSLHDTLYLLLSINEVKYADKLRSEFKVPDRRYWWLRIQTLAELSDWNGLENFSKVKKSPVGYAPFVDACLKYKNNFEAVKYLPKVREELKVKYYLKAEKYDEAAQIAFEQRDLQGLIFIQGKCGNRLVLNEKVSGYIAQLSSRK